MKKNEIFLCLSFYDMTVPSKSNVPSLFRPVGLFRPFVVLSVENSYN